MASYDITPVVLLCILLFAPWLIFKILMIVSRIAYRVLTHPGFWIVIFSFLSLVLFRFSESNVGVLYSVVTMFIAFLLCQRSLARSLAQSGDTGYNRRPAQSTSDDTNDYHHLGYHNYTDYMDGSTDLNYNRVDDGTDLGYHYMNDYTVTNYQGDDYADYQFSGSEYFGRSQSIGHIVRNIDMTPGTERVTIKKASKKEFHQVKNRFNQKWKKGTCGRLREVLIIDNPKLKKRFQAYLSNLSKPTKYRYYHGTKLECNIHYTVSFCSKEECGICGISQHGFLVERKSTNIPNFQRFGDGFYLAPNSSKCHDYTQGHGYYRAMLLFDVAQGKRFISQRNNTRLTAPPAGYDSVYGRRGESLNYDEIIVYDPDAALPTHILIYELDGIHKIAT